MRKTLVAGAAMISGMLAWAPVATAQQQTQSATTPPPNPAPLPNLGQSFGPTTATPGRAYWLNPPLSAAPQAANPFTPPAGSPPSIGQPYGATATAIPAYWNAPPLAAGDVTVRLQGRITSYIGAATDSGRNPGLITLAPGAAPVAANTKLAGYQVTEYARLYPSVDGVAANGLKYGAYLEIRQDNAVAPGGGANGSISAAANARAALYFYRETGYFGTPDFGYVRFGATDGPLSLFTTGTNEAFNSGGWNGDKIAFTTNTIPVWPFDQYPNEYTTTKVVYVSPRFANTFDFAVSFEPNTGNVNGGPGNCPYANTVAGTVIGTSSTGAGCDATSSTSVANETARRRNTIEAALRGIGTLGPVGVAGTLGFADSGHVQYDGTSSVTRYDGLGFIDSGIQLTYGGWQAGAHINAGRVNGAWALDPKGGRDAVDWVAGASYVFGSLSLGVQYINLESAGAWTPLAVNVARTRRKSGVGAGGVLNLAPNTFLILNYLYGVRHQPGVDLLTGVTNARTHNNTLAQGVSLGMSIRW